MNRLPLVLAALAIPGAAFAQAGTAQSVTKAQATAKLDAEYAEIDTNKDKKLSKAEIEARISAQNNADLQLLTKRRDETFAKMDTDKSGTISKAEFNANVKIPSPPAPNGASALAKFDTNKDGSVSLDEYRTPSLANFAKIDKNKDGTLSTTELQALKR